MSDWRYVRAMDFCASVRDGTHDSPKEVEAGRTLVTSRHLTSGRLDLRDAYLISDADFEAINRRSKVDKWDVLISMIGTVGEVCLVTEEPKFAIKNIGLFKTKCETDGRWLYYYLRTPAAQQAIREQSRGTTQEYIPLGALRELHILIPPTLAHQRAIAHILGTLDDKIELNRRMNETLEAMARALFKSWFVDFDPVRAKAEGRDTGLPQEIANLFPDSFEDSELGEIPKGWRVGSILEQADLLSGGTPKTDVPAYWDGPIPWASAKDVSQCGTTFLAATERTITELGVAKSATKILPAFTTVIVARGATTGRLTMLGHDMAMNQTCYGLRTKIDAPFFLYCHVRDFIDRMVSAAHGSVFDTITTSTFEATKVLLPEPNLAQAFNELVAPMFEQIRRNICEASNLAVARDALLPRLLSGALSTEVPT